MPARHNNQPWVIALRDMLRISIGSAWSITEQSGKVKITVRFQDKSKSYATIPIPWLPARSRDIEDAMIKIANLVQGGRTLKEAVAALYGANKKAPISVQAPSSDLLETCWNSYGRAKVGTNKFKQSTWDNDYQPAFKRIEPVLDQCIDAVTLLNFAGDNLEAGCRSREIAVQTLARWLRWAVKENYLDKDMMNNCIYENIINGKKEPKKACLRKFNITQIINPWEDVVKDEKNYSCQEIKAYKASRNPLNRKKYITNYCKKRNY